MATLGFGIPFALNKFIKTKVDEDKSKISQNGCALNNSSEIFNSFKHTK